MWMGQFQFPKLNQTMIWPCRPDAEFQVWAKCAKLTGLGQMSKVIWFGPNEHSYLVWAKCAKLSFF